MENDQVREAKPLSEAPTWGVAIVLTVLIIVGFSLHICLKKLGKWLDETKRKSLLAALEKIKEELMLFGLLSLLMGHWILFVAKICVSSSSVSSRFYPCPVNGRRLTETDDVIISSSKYFNDTIAGKLEQIDTHLHSYCHEGQQSFASYESLEQLHRFLFTLGVTHVLYSIVAVALAMVKISSWRTWENHAKTMAIQSIQGPSRAPSNNVKLGRLATFISHHVSHPWSKHRVLVWLLCFSRQFWSSINQADYMALRLGFITTHQLPPTYDFHNYMLRSMEEEFRDVVGISVPLWIYALLCIFLNFHGTNIYFWLSFLPVILILLIGTKLHRVVVKLAVEIMHNTPWIGFHQFNLRDELFWFKRPKLVLWLIQLISFQNALEMASFIWSLWEIRNWSCFMNNRSFVVIRLAFGVISQCWCSFITFPLYVIVTQMGSKFKKAVVSENVRISLSKWKKRVQERHNSSDSTHTSTAPDSVEEGSNNSDNIMFGCAAEEGSLTESVASVSPSSLRCKQLSNEENLKSPLWHHHHHGSDLSDDDA